MTRPFVEFDSIITQRLADFGDEPERSTFTEPKPRPRIEGRDEEFWQSTKAHWYSKRTAGYLAGYVEFSRSDAIPAEGIETSDGYVWLDKGVMSSLLTGECVSFRDHVFHLTEKRQALISPFVPPSAYVQGHS